MALGLPNLCCSVKGGHLHHPLGVAAWGPGPPPAIAGLPPHLQKVQGGLWGIMCWDWDRARPGQGQGRPPTLERTVFRETWGTSLGVHTGRVLNP